MTKENEIIEKISNLKDFMIIGLGRFGRSVALTLYANGKEVLGMDSDTENVKSVENKVSTAVVGDATNHDVLYSLGAQNFDCAVICIGDNLEASILVTQICKELGIKYIVAKAQSSQHAKILSSIGADLIIYPEELMGQRLGRALSKSGVNELAELSDDTQIFEAALPESWNLKTVAEVSEGKKYRVNILVIRRAGSIIYPTPDTVLMEEDLLVMAGDSSKLNNVFTHADGIDIRDSLQKAFGKYNFD